MATASGRSRTEWIETPFSSGESFGLFMEGLRALQQYGDEADRERTRPGSLKYFVDQAVERLRECVRLYDGDVLPRYYLGVAVTALNQHTYVERIAKLIPSFIALGRYHALSDAGRTPRLQLGPADSYADLAFEAAQEAADATELDQQPWPLLREAVLQFKEVLERIEPEGGDTPRRLPQLAFIRHTLYNFAEVHTRIGGALDLDQAAATLTRLRELPSTVPKMPSMLQRIVQRLRIGRELVFDPDGDPESEAKEREENVALELQAETLGLQVKARQALAKLMVPHPAATAERASLGQVLDELKLRKAILDGRGDLPPRLKTAIVADLLTKRGYLLYWIALSSGREPGQTCREYLTEAAELFRNALEMKPHWSPAQIYLALVNLVRSGVAEGEAGVADRRGRADDEAARKAEAKRLRERAMEMLSALVGAAPTSEPTPAKAAFRVEGTLQPIQEPAQPQT